MLQELFATVKASLRFRSYRQVDVSFKHAWRWLYQFDGKQRQAICDFLEHVIYFDEHAAVQLLLKAHDRLVTRLKNDGVGTDRIIYMQIDEAGSSSAATLNLLRDHAKLEAKGATFLDSRDIAGINTVTSDIADGAIIYVDDFIGSGSQFESSQEYVRQYVVGNFSEFLLAACVCEEAIENLRHAAVAVEPGKVHTKEERPLLSEHKSFGVSNRMIVQEVCTSMQSEFHPGLGFRNMAAMVVFYRNTPDNCPLILRGCIGQSPKFGLLPRSTDFKRPSRMVPAT